MEKLEFKGTKWNLELKFISGVCIGIGTIGNPYQVTANSILPDTYDDYEKEKQEIESNMKLYASSPDLLEALLDLVWLYENHALDNELKESINLKAKKAIEKALK